VKRISRNSIGIAGIAGIFVAFWGIFFLFWRKKLLNKTKAGDNKFVQGIHKKFSGLTEVQAQSRITDGIDNSLSYKPQRTTKDIWRENIFSIFNLSLIGISGVQFLLGMYLDALASFGVMLLNIGINIFQELFARHRLKELIFSTRFESTAIRGNKARSINPNEIVQGDIIALGPGDQIVVDGILLTDSELLVDESLLTGKSERFLKTKGDAVYAGGYCISGHALYEVNKIGDDRAIFSILNRPKFLSEELTPLEKIIDRVLKVLLIVVGIFTVILLAYYFQIDPLGLNALFNSAASVIFSIAPAGLYFMILVTYTMGTADMAKIGALVNRARSVEAMAQVNEVCISKSGILTDLQFEINIIEDPELDSTISKSRIRQILGDFVHSTTAKSRLITTLADNLEGNRRNAIENAPFMHVYGYCAIVTDEEDLRGVYALGYPELLEGYLLKSSLNEKRTDGLQTSKIGARRLLNRVTGFFGRDEKKDGRKSNHKKKLKNGTASGFENEKSEEKNFFSKFINNVKRIVPKSNEDINEDFSNPEKKPVAELLFVYTPELNYLYKDTSEPILCDGLIPLARITFTEEIKKEAVRVIKTFAETGIQLKIISMDKKLTDENFRTSSGLYIDLDHFGHISGEQLSTLDGISFKNELDKNAFFTEIQPAMLSRIVQSLHSEGRNIAVMGDSVNDVSALLNANLAVTRQTSSQAALSVSDIVLLNSKPDVIKKILEKGQRIVRGLIDILKLYITQAVYLTLLIISTFTLVRGFPYKSAQGSLIAIVTITIPSLGLTLFARPGIIDSGKFALKLRRFIFPASITIAIAASVVYYYFYDLYAEIAYAQLAVTYALVFTGLMLVVFVSPPVKILAGGSDYTGAWEPTILSFIMLLVFIIAAPLNITKKFFELDVLNQSADYLFIGVVAVSWAVTVQLLWRFINFLLKTEN
jgi:magnesium-transporting ATPase (P-type)